MGKVKVKGNEHIEKFLNYYTSVDDPGYAVLLKGKWGSGKTYFIKDYLNSLDTKKSKFLYVSLYGMTDIESIDRNISQQINPVLTHKSVLMAKNMGGSFLRNRYKFDWRGDNLKEPLIRVPNGSTARHFFGTVRSVLVFDDLERSSLNLEILFGYINYFIEHQSLRVVIIANPNKVDKLKKYRKTKEKFIGEEFEVISDERSVLENIIFTFKQDEVTRILLSKNIPLILEVFIQSGTKSYRILKQGLQYFGRIHQVLSKTIQAKDALISHLLRVFLALFFEIRVARLESIKIKSIWGIEREYSKEGKQKRENLLTGLNARYGDFNAHHLLLEASVWQDIFDKGVIESGAINKSLAQSRYFYDENTPNWKRLWDYVYLTDSEFEEILKTVEDEFYGYKFDSLGEIKHVVGMFLDFSELGLFSRDANEMITFSKSYIDKKITDGKITSITEDERSSYMVYGENSFDGLGYKSFDSPYFQDFSNYVNEQREKINETENKELSKRLIGFITSDPQGFYNDVGENGRFSPNKGHVTPILSYVDVETFSQALVSAPSISRYWVQRAIEKRYSFSHAILIKELSFLKAVKLELEKYVKMNPKKLSSVSTKNHTIGYFSNAIDVLEKSNSE